MDKKLGCYWCNRVKDPDYVVIIEPSGTHAKYDVFPAINFCLNCGRELSPRPMTLEEAEVYRGLVWIEYRHGALECIPREMVVVKDDSEHEPESFIYTQGWRSYRCDYGKLYRFWRTKPTPEQSAAFPWKGEAALEMED